MNPVTLRALETFPAQLEAHYGAIPPPSSIGHRRRGRFEGYGAVSLRSLVHYLCSHDRQHLAGLQWLLGKIEASRVQG